MALEPLGASLGLDPLTIVEGRAEQAAKRRARRAIRMHILAGIVTLGLVAALALVPRFWPHRLEGMLAVGAFVGLALITGQAVALVVSQRSNPLSSKRLLSQLREQEAGEPSADQEPEGAPLSQGGPVT